MEELRRHFRESLRADPIGAYRQWFRAQEELRERGERTSACALADDLWELLPELAFGPAEERARFFHNAAQGLEYFALLLYRGLHFGVPRESHVPEHCHTHALETANAEGQRELASRLIYGNRQVVVKSRQNAQEERAVSNIASDRSRNRQRKPTKVRRNIGNAPWRGPDAHNIAEIWRIAQ